ncbi:WD repeat-containing protein 63 [Gryllus bimaculatus]|nr:WD repeat-containing protein 63 [Gryllus bimaculatus]
MYLESPREIHCLQFSPVNGNILVGGLVNGQIIVWDIGEHLEGIQEISFTLELSSKNQRAIAAHLRWMKAKKPKTYIPPCAISSLQSSHTTCVMGIQWVSPFWHVTESGDFLRLKGSTRSQEFITCAHDGCVNFWDLKNMKAEIKLKSHPRKESARRTGGKSQLIPKLTPHFKVLTQGSEAAEQDKDLDGQPIGVPLCVMAVDYIHVPRKKEKTSLKSMKHLTAGKQLISYPSSPEIPDIKPKSDDDSLGSDKKDKQLKVTRKREITIPKSEVVVGSLEGVVTKIIWNDFDSDTEQTSGPQVGTFAYWGEVHDGPVTSLVRSPFIRDLVLSVGGKIFALWIESAKGNLLYRRKSSVLMTSGSWSVHRPSMFYITRIDGKMEIWDLFVKSDQDSFHQRLSGKLLTGVYPHIHLAQSIIGVADTNAQFRMLCVPSQHTKVEHDQVGKLHHLIQQEISRKESFIIWQKNWEERNAEMLKARREAAELEAKRQEEAEREKARKIKEQKKRKQQQLEERKRRLAEIRAKTFTWKKDAEKKWTKEQEDYLIKTRLKQKKLDKEKLQIEQKPYISSLEEEKAKKAKQKERLSQKQQIYEQSVNSCFPELTENVKNGNTSSEIDILQVVEKDILDSKPYEDVEKDALIYIKNHPFEMKFNWIQFLKEAHIRERRLQEGIIQGYLSST